MVNNKKEQYPKISIKEFLILSLLENRKKMFGSEMVQASAGELKRGTIYLTLQRMSEKGYVESSVEPRIQPEIGVPRRMYQITDFGRRVLDKNSALSRLLQEELLDVEQAADLLFVSGETLEQWIEAGEIEFVEGRDGEIRIGREHLLSEETKSFFEQGRRWEIVRREEAIAHGEYWFGKTIESNPKYAVAIHELGRMYFCLGRYYDAVEPLKRAIELNRDAWQAWMNLGKCYYEMHRLDEAEKCFRNVIRIDPTFVKGHHETDTPLYLQGLNYNRDKLFEALRVLRSAIKRDPTCHTSAYFVRTMLGSSYMATFDLRAAAEFSHEIKEHLPDIAADLQKLIALETSRVSVSARIKF